MKTVSAIFFIICFFSPCALHAQTDSPAEAAISNDAGQAKLERTREFLKSHQDKDRVSKETGSAAQGSGYLVRMLQGLVLCLGVLLVGVYLLKKFNPQLGATSGRRIRILERTAITPRTALVLAEIEGSRVVMAVGAERVAFISPTASLNSFGDCVESLAKTPGEV